MGLLLALKTCARSAEGYGPTLEAGERVAARVAGCTAADDIMLQDVERLPVLAHTGTMPHQRTYTSEAAAVQGAVHGIAAAAMWDCAGP